MDDDFVNVSLYRVSNVEQTGINIALEHPDGTLTGNFDRLVIGGSDRQQPGHRNLPAFDRMSVFFKLSLVEFPFLAKLRVGCVRVHENGVSD